MKTIKLLLCLLAFSALTFYSCSDSDPIKDTTVSTQNSIAMRTALNEIKKSNNISNRSAATNPFCFEFVYPLTFSFNNTTTITVTSFEGLLDILANETPELYLESIHYPFSVAYEGALHTISSEADFSALIDHCGFNSYNDDLLYSYCFDIIYPIDIIVGDDVLLTIHSSQELAAYLSAPGTTTGANIVFPISVSYNNQVVVVHSLYEFYQMVNNCNANNCICTQEYAPVCVQTPTGTVEFGNMCYAICAGFSQNDIVSCNPQTDCSITNVSVAPGACTTTGYALTINFSYANTTATTFTLSDHNNQLIGEYPLSSLPLTINYNLLTNATDFIHINVGDCQATGQWITPLCGCTCPTNFDPVCVNNPNGGITQYTNACHAICAGYTQNDFVNCGVAPSNFGTQLGSCFYMSYPVYVQYQGALVIVNSNSELLQYYFPAMSPIPALHYPVTVTFANSVYTFNNQAEFEAHIAASCN